MRAVSAGSAPVAAATGAAPFRAPLRDAPVFLAPIPVPRLVNPCRITAAASTRPLHVSQSARSEHDAFHAPSRYLRSPSVSSRTVPHGSTMVATEMPSDSSRRYGVASAMPLRSSSAQNACKPRTSKPTWSTARPAVPTRSSARQPAEEIQHVADTGQIGADEEVGLAFAQRRVERLHVPLLHLDELTIHEVHVVVRDRRRVGRHVGDELDLDAIGADEIREAPIVAGRRRARRLAGRRLATDGERVTVGDDLGRQRRHVGHRQADVVERRAARRAARCALRAARDRRRETRWRRRCRS